jgi:hypothetical protein
MYTRLINIKCDPLLVSDVIFKVIQERYSNHPYGEFRIIVTLYQCPDNKDSKIALDIYPSPEYELKETKELKELTKMGIIELKEDRYVDPRMENKIPKIMNPYQKIIQKTSSKYVDVYEIVAEDSIKIYPDNILNVEAKQYKIGEIDKLVVDFWINLHKNILKEVNKVFRDNFRIYLD